MKDLLFWVRQLIAGLAKCLATFFSSIANALDPVKPIGSEVGIEVVERVTITVSNKGVVYLKKAGTQSWPKNGDKDENDGDEKPQFSTLSAAAAGGGGQPCCEVFVVDGKFVVKPVPCN